jgi:hypothetical protein
MVEMFNARLRAGTNASHSREQELSASRLAPALHALRLQPALDALHYSIFINPVYLILRKSFLIDFQATGRSDDERSP